MEQQIEIKYTDQDGVPEDWQVLKTMLDHLGTEDFPLPVDETYTFTVFVPGMGDTTFQLVFSDLTLTAILTLEN